MSPADYLSALIVVLLVVVIAILWRLTNSRGSVSWNVTTTEPESSVLRGEVRVARAAAEDLRGALEAKDASLEANAAEIGTLKETIRLQDDVITRLREAAMGGK